MRDLRQHMSSPLENCFSDELQVIWGWDSSIVVCTWRADVLKNVAKNGLPLTQWDESKSQVLSKKKKCVQNNLGFFHYYPNEN